MQPLARRGRFLDRLKGGPGSSVVGDEKRQFHVVNSDLLTDAPPEPRVLIIERLGRWINVNAGRDRPEHSSTVPSLALASVKPCSASAIWASVSFGIGVPCRQAGAADWLGALVAAWVWGLVPLPHAASATGAPIYARTDAPIHTRGLHRMPSPLTSGADACCWSSAFRGLGQHAVRAILRAASVVARAWCDRHGSLILPR